jgi:hypothetical protein
VGIAGGATPEQRKALAAAGMRSRGEGGRKHRDVHSFFEVEAGSQDEAVARIAEVVPDLKEVWEKRPPRVIPVKND